MIKFWLVLIFKNTKKTRWSPSVKNMSIRELSKKKKKINPVIEFVNSEVLKLCKTSQKFSRMIAQNYV